MKKKGHDDGPFDRDYVADVQTSTAPPSAKSEDMLEIQENLYGVAKPRRVVLRGKIIREE